jgi:C_GCAxxG_C_C family probable redox protein
MNDSANVNATDNGNVNEKLLERIRTLTLSGFHCSQIVHLLAQEQNGEEVPQLISAMGGLGGGLYSGLNCGTLSGACALLSSYCARGSLSEPDRYPYKQLVHDLVEWFGERFGSVNCGDLVSASVAERFEKCPVFIAETFTKCQEILAEHGIETEVL